MTGTGVPVGASIAYERFASKPGSAASEAVGTSGKQRHRPRRIVLRHCARAVASKSETISRRLQHARIARWKRAFIAMFLAARAVGGRSSRQKILQVYVAEVGWDRLAEVRAFLGSVIAGLVRDI